MLNPHQIEQFLVYLRARIAEGGRGIQTRLAEYLGKDRSTVTHILSGKRPPTEQEVKLIKEFFGDGGDSTAKLREVQLGGGVPVVGRIGENIWTKSALHQAAVKPVYVGAVVTEYPIEHQKAYIVEEDTEDGEYLKGDFVYTVPFADYRARALPDDEVVVLTIEDGFERYTLRRASPTDLGVGLTPLSRERLLPVPPAKNETITGLVIGYFRTKRKP